jgi:DNA-damage-inducible protein J
MMAATNMAQVRLVEDIKARPTTTLAATGPMVSDAIRVFLPRVVAEQQLPFPLAAPHAETRAAMIEARAIVKARIAASAE